MKRLLETIGKSITNRLMRSACCLFCVLAVATMLPATSAFGENKPEFEIKLATLAPENSSLMQVFNEMNAEVLRETGGKVGFKMFAGFVMGDEEDVLRKLRVGLVHSAVFTATALTDMDPALRSLQIPFLFSNYGEVDYVMDKMEPDFRAALLKEGYEVLGWPELGFLYFMSTSPIAGLEDLKGKKVWAKANMPMSQAMIDRAGVSTVAIGLPDVLVALQTHLLDVVYNSPYYALVTQWNTQVKYFTDLPLSYIGGALLVDRKIMAKMPPPLQENVRKVCAAHLQRLNEKTRKDNDEAIQIILKRGVQKVTPDAAHVKGFKDLSDEAMAGLDAKFLPPAAVSKVRAALAEYRAQHPSKP